MNDVNFAVAGFLYDLAALQSAKTAQWGYRGAARAVLELDRPLDRLARQRSKS